MCVVESDPEVPDEDRKHARDLPDEAWVQTALRYEDKEEEAENGKEKLRWGWHLFSGKVKPLSQGKKMTVVSRASERTLPFECSRTLC